MMNSHGADPAILKGLVDAGCEVRDTYSVAEAFSHLRNTCTRSEARNLMLVAEVQAGAIPLLTLLHETGVSRPPTLLFDQDGSNVHFAIMALKLGVQDYILASEPAVQRELRARVLAERTKTIERESRQLAKAATATLPQIGLPSSPAYIAKPEAEVEFQWDAKLHMVHIHNTYIHLCPVEGRIFNLLFTHRNQIVSAQELLEVAVKRTGSDLTESTKLLRPHITRLRIKLDRHAKLAHHVVNVRSNGYMFI
jgi:DNA-binding response OmpR family regulator